MNEFHKTSMKYNYSRVDIAFCDKVDMTIRDFPPFNFSSFLASLGGTLGLWLGLGILQILDSILIKVQWALAVRGSQGRQVNLGWPIFGNQWVSQEN